MPSDIPSNDFSRITLDPNGQILGAGPTFVVEADLSQPVTLPPGVEYVGPAPVFGVDYGPGIGGTPAAAQPVVPATPPPPATVEPATPPLEGEVIPGPGGNPTTIFEDYGDLPPDPEDPAYRGYRPIIEGEQAPPPSGRGAPLDPPPWWVGPASRIGRAILGPLGGAIPQIIEATLPEVLGSGELPFPPIPQVNIPPPEVNPTWPTIPPLPSIPAPPLAQPSPPDVVVVSAPAPVAPSAGTTTTPLPSISTLPANVGYGMAAAIGAIVLPRLTPRRRGIATPASDVFGIPQPVPQPITNTLTQPDPLTPPAGEFLPGTTPVGLTQPQPQLADFGVPQISDPTRTTECNCDEPGQRKKRKKPRKCLTRANLIWAGGPKAGKPAGSRCIKFEDFLP